MLFPVRAVWREMKKMAGGLFSRGVRGVFALKFLGMREGEVVEEVVFEGGLVLAREVYVLVYPLVIFDGSAQRLDHFHVVRVCHSYWGG